MSRRVAIVGFGEGRTQAPYDDPSWEVWGLNAGHRVPRAWLKDGRLRAKSWFQIHPPAGCDAGEREFLNLLNFGHFDVPTYVQPQCLDEWRALYPHAALRGLLLPYPIDAVKAEFPGGWFANTFCLQIALALHQGVDEVGLFGVELAGYGRELAVERPAVAYWMGVCAALDVSLTVAAQSFFPYPEVYGFDYWQEAKRAASLTEMVLPALDRLSDGENFDTLTQIKAAEA